MNHVDLLILAIVAVIGLLFKFFAALIVARKDITPTKAKIIAELFNYNPLSIFKDFLIKRD